MTAILGSVRLAFESLRLHPLRTVLSILGIVMGAGSLAAVLALADGGERLARQAIEREGLQAVVLRPQTERRVDGLRLPQSSYPLFGEADALRLSEALGPEAGVTLTVEGTGTIEAAGQRTRAARVIGRFALNTGSAPAAGVAEGRTLHDPEMRAGAPVAVLSAKLAEELKAAGVQGGRVGETLIVGGRPLQTIGVLQPGPGENVFTILMPFGAAEPAMVPSRDPRPRSIAVRAGSIENVAVVRAAVERFAAAQQGWDGKVTISSYGPERLEQASRAVLVFKLLMGTFTAISLLVGGIGIMNVLLASILERTREIGVRRAVGARRRDVMRQFLVESMTISLVGAAAGVALGLAAAFLATGIIRARTDAPLYVAITWQTLVITAIAAVSVGFAAGVYPAIRASRLTTIDAIQRE